MLKDEETKHHSSSSSSWWVLCCRNCSHSSSITVSSSEADNKEEEASYQKKNMKKKKPGGWKAMPYILGNETFARFAACGLVANFTMYLQNQLHLEKVDVANFMNIWGGITNFAPLAGAFISDAYIGRFKTIAYASFANLLGMAVVTLTSWLPSLHPPPCTPLQLEHHDHHCVKANTTQLGVLILGFGFLTIGSAGIIPCSIPFGVDQFDPTTEEGQKGINSFFNWYYTTFTVVLIISQTVVVYIQDSISWKIGFAIPTLCMFLSIILFFVGTKIYVHVKPEGSIFSGIAQVLVAAYRKRHVDLPSDDENKIDGVFYDPPLMEGSSVLSKLPLTPQFRSLNKACLITEGELNPDGTRVNQWRLASIQQVEEVKCLARIFPIWAAGILSLTSMAQQGTFTIFQAGMMNRNLGPKFQIPPGSITVISLITIGLWLPFYDRVFVPSLRKITKHEGGITLLQRIGIGMVFSVLSMVVAGLVEKSRRDLANSNPDSIGIAPISVMWLAPQLILMGLCEAFNIIGQIEFFNRQFPEHMKSIANSLLSCSFGVSSYVSSIMVMVVHRTTRTKTNPDWLTNNLNDGRLDYFYYLIAVIAALNMVYFLAVARRYRYKPTGDFPVDVELASQKGQVKN